MVKKLGADFTIDYTRQDHVPEGMSYDFIMDSVGKAKTSKFKRSCKNALSPNGKYVSIDDSKLKLDSHQLKKIKDLTENGHITPFLDKCYDLKDIVEAHRFVEKGHKKGGVAITIT